MKTSPSSRSPGKSGNIDQHRPNTEVGQPESERTRVLAKYATQCVQIVPLMAFRVLKSALLVHRLHAPCVPLIRHRHSRTARTTERGVSCSAESPRFDSRLWALLI